MHYTNAGCRDRRGVGRKREIRGSFRLVDGDRLLVFTRNMMILPIRGLQAHRSFTNVELRKKTTPDEPIDMFNPAVVGKKERTMC